MRIKGLTTSIGSESSCGCPMKSSVSYPAIISNGWSLAVLSLENHVTVAFGFGSSVLRLFVSRDFHATLVLPEMRQATIIVARAEV